MTLTVASIATATAILVILNFLSVFVALATLRWKDARDKRAIANIFIKEVGAKLQTEADFQNIINNLRIQDPDESKDNE